MKELTEGFFIMIDVQKVKDAVEEIVNIRDLQNMIK